MGLPVGAHDNLVSIGVDVALAKGKGLRQNVVTGSHQVNKEHFMVLNETEDSLIVVACALGAESNNDPLRRVWLHNALSHREGEQIALVREELEASGQVTVVDDIEESVSGLLSRDLSKLDSLGRETHIEAISLSLAAEFNLVSTEGAHFE